VIKDGSYFKKSLANSLGTTRVSKEYDPFAFFTMLITFVNCLASADLSVATTFFAILLNLFMNSHAL